jgi:hypothetical protein
MMLLAGTAQTRARLATTGRSITRAASTVKPASVRVDDTSTGASAGEGAGGSAVVVTGGGSAGAVGSIVQFAVM